MSQSIISARVDDLDKKQFEQFCDDVGMNVSTAINMFIKTVIREKRLPFAVCQDPFYSEENIKRIKKAVAELDRGKGTEHELL